VIAAAFRCARPKSSPGRQGRKAPAPIGIQGQRSDIAALERQSGDMLGLKVQITHAPRAARSPPIRRLDQLDMICQRLSGEKI
jgi:ParB family chromosome partitioning protein